MSDKNFAAPAQRTPQPQRQVAGRQGAATARAKRVKEAERPAQEGDTRGIALALLKDFYWIEIGIRSYLRACGNPEFSRSEGMVIANITLGYNRPSDIARQIGVSRQAIHATIQQMKAKGIVDLVNDPDDQRIKLVVITDLAKKMNDDGIVAMGVLWNELGRRLGSEKLAQAARVLSADWGEPILFDPNDSAP